MGAFMINATQGHAVVTLPKNITGKYDGKFEVRNATPKINIQHNDEFASIVNNHETNFLSEKIEMLNRGYVSSVTNNETKQLTEKELDENRRRAKRGRNPLKYYIHTIKFEEATPFTHYKFLDDYTYSLLKIYKRYIRPVRHFSRVITELPVEDFETLKKERIFVERTLFGRLINALPYQNRLQFILYAIDKFNEADLRKIHFSKIYPDLKEFVGTGVVQMGKYLIKSQNLIEKHSEIFQNDINIGFGYDADLKNLEIKDPKKRKQDKVDYINSQSSLFQEAFNIEDDFDDLFSMDKFQISKEDRVLFDNLFSKRAWPIDYNTDYK